jgi:ABC-type phosphate/phosphonate transport system substrate-binding protein
VLRVGGMAFILLVLRPSLAVPAPSARFALQGMAFRRFFRILWHVMSIAIVTVVLLRVLKFGSGPIPWPVTVMQIAGAVMAVVFVINMVVLHRQFQAKLASGQTTQVDLQLSADWSRSTDPWRDHPALRSGPLGMSTARLPMYALPEMAAANAALWAAIRDSLAEAGVGDLPIDLSPSPPALPATIFPATLFSQMCGYPLRRLYDGQYQLLGTPLYDLPGCAMPADGVPTHCSFIVVPRDSAALSIVDLRGSRFAINGADSNSGMNLPRRLFAPLAEGGRFFGVTTVTGGHVKSMEAIVAGDADAASIDCVTFGFCASYRPALVAALRTLAETPASPAIPFITAATTPPATVAALIRMLTNSNRVRDALAGLHITAVVPSRPEAYDAVLTFEEEASALGYPALA